VLTGVDPMSDRPVYRQIADSLRGAIERGELAPGDRLPSESQLMERFGVAQGTVRNALGQLRGEGLVIAEHGRPSPRSTRVARTGPPAPAPAPTPRTTPGSDRRTQPKRRERLASTGCPSER
jgi:DNA-binding FadR family transcriptional regulator